MSYFLRHTIGFFLQIFPCAYLCFLPFPETSYRFRKKYVMPVCAALAVCFSALFPAVMRVPVDGLAMNYANPYMLMVIALFVGGYCYVIREKALKKMLVVSLVVFYAATQYLCVNMVLQIFFHGPMEEVFGWPSLILYAVTTAIFLPFATRLIGHAVRDYLAEIDINSIKRDYLWVLTVSIVYFVMMFLYTSLTAFDTPEFGWVSWPTFLFLAIVLSGFYYSLFRQSVRQKRENILRRYEGIQRVQAEKIKSEMESIKRMRHDTRHYLREAYTLLSQERSEEALHYLEDVIEQTQSTETKQYCENLTVNALLQYYADWAEREDVRISVKASCGEISLDAADLTAVFGNVLENAIEACLKSAPDKRFIHVDVGVVGSSLIIQVKNRCETACLLPNLPVQNGFAPAEAFVSARPDGGMGLKSVSLTASRYGGEARFAFDPAEKAFISQIRMNSKPN